LSGHDTELLTRLDAVSAAVTSIHTVLDSFESLDEVLQQVARNAVGAVTDAEAVSITTLVGDQPRTVACTDDFVLALDAQQYRAGGPCVEAARSGQPVRVAMDTSRQRWPDFASAAHAAGVRATLSIPLIITAADFGDGDSELAGSLNAYSRSTSAFDAVDEKLLSLYTGVACQAIAAAHRWQRLSDTVSQLEEALVSRSDIDQAKGALRVLNGGSAEDAFTTLVARSQRENIKLRVIAQRVVQELSRRLPPT
jgi:GAF domain-containing protein